MSELRKANTDKTYFLTFSTVGWIDVFTRKELSDIIIEKLKIARRDHSIAIYVYVIMPSHIHLIAQKTDTKLLSKWVDNFKSLFSKDIVEAVITGVYESRRSRLGHLVK